MTRSQDRLYAYIRTLLPRAEAAREVLQETNVILLRKADQLAEGQPFEAWACSIAYHEVLSYRRDNARDRHVFDDALLLELAAGAEPLSQAPDDRAEALENCLERLSGKERAMLSSRYADGGSVNALAETEGRPARTIATQLFRIRQMLLDCVEHKLADQ
jgi:RNA polymerase sigma-70 factor (ECF subfamily)